MSIEQTNIRTSHSAGVGQKTRQSAADEGASDSALWTEILTGKDLAKFARAWLTILSRSAPWIVEAVFLHGSPNSGPYQPIARWSKNPGEQSAEHFSRGATAILTAITESRRPAIEAADGGDQQKYAGIPLLVDADLHGAVLVEASIADTADSRRLMRHLQWGSAWMEAFLRRSSDTRDHLLGYRATVLVDTLNAVVSQEGYLAACQMLASRLAQVFVCERVAFGHRRHKAIRVVALHQTSSFERRNSLGRAIEAAMDEAVDQHMTLVTPSLPSASYVAYAQEALARNNEGAAILTVPVMRAGETIGALTLERYAGKQFCQDDLDLCDAIAAAVGPVLADKRARDASIPRIALERVHRLLGRVIGPGHFGIKVACVVVVAVAMFLALATDTYRIHARAQIQGEVRRIINAPFDGYIRTQQARAGQVVHEGDIVAELQDNELNLDRLRHIAQRRQYQLELDRALSKRDLAQTNIARAQIEQKDAEIDLTEQMIARAQIRAPFDAVVVSGDLSQSVGKPVTRGDPLFELAPLDRYRLTLLVPETDIQSVRPGQAGAVLFTALPERPFRFELKTLTPVARAADGINGFEALADLREGDSRLRPAMEGLAKIEIGTRRLAWIWTHELYYWVRVRLWNLFP